MAGRLSPLLAGLLRPEAYAHPVLRVTLIETHISWVLLAGDYAYKLKRPVKYAFVDLTDPRGRAHLCNEELRLNRRFSPDLYLDVCSVTREADTVKIGGDGEVVEHAVRMRQFSRDDELDRLLVAGRVDPAELEAFGRSLAHIHSRVPTASFGQRLGRAEGAAAVVRGNVVECEAVSEPLGTASQVKALGAMLDESLISLEPLLARRFDSGHVRECHGDLHTGNIVRYEGTLVAFDCIEFEPAFRFIDVADEVAFLLVDLRRLQRLEHARAFLDGYLLESGDYEVCRLISLFEAHRGLVRAKIAAIKLAGQLEAPERDALVVEHQAFIQAASSALAPAKPRLILMTGLSGSGKTWFARKLAPKLGALHLRSDVERKKLMGLGEGAPSHSSLGRGAYSDQASVEVYDRLIGCAADALSGGFSVIVDATFQKRRERARFAALAERHGLTVELVSCTAPHDVLVARVTERSRQGLDASEADAAVLAFQEQNAESISDSEGLSVVEVDTSADHAVEAALAALQTPAPKPR